MDQEIWEFAIENEFTILTKDNDFDELSQLFGCPPKVVHLMCGNKETSYVANLIILNKSELIDFVNSDMENCLLKLFAKIVGLVCTTFYFVSRKER